MKGKFEINGELRGTFVTFQYLRAEAEVQSLEFPREVCLLENVWLHWGTTDPFPCPGWKSMRSDRRCQVSNFTRISQSKFEADGIDFDLVSQERSIVFCADKRSRRSNNQASRGDQAKKQDIVEHYTFSFKKQEQVQSMSLASNNRLSSSQIRRKLPPRFQ